MENFWAANGITSLIFRVVLYDTTSVNGGGKTGLTNSSAGLIISTIADNEATATTYTQSGATIDTITTLGTFAAPSANHCRFKEVDSVNFPGEYEIQISDARWAVSSARYVDISMPYVSALGFAGRVWRVRLTAADPQNASSFGLSNLDAKVSLANTTAHFDTIIGTPVSSVSADIAEVEAETDGISAIPTNPLLTNDARLNNLDATISSRNSTAHFDTILGTPAVSVSADIAEVEAETDGIASIPTNPLLTNDARLNNLDAPVSSRTSTAHFDSVIGTPVGASISVDIAEIEGETDSLLTNVAAIPTTPVLTAHFDAILGTPVVSVSADIAEIEGETDGISSIPTNPLLANDARLNNLDAAVSSRNSTSHFDAILGSPTVSVSADIAEIESETDGISAIPTNPLLTTDSRLNHLDADVSSRLSSSSVVIRSGTAQAGTANTITLDAGASAIDGFYVTPDPVTVLILSGPGAGQIGTPSAYNGTTKRLTIAGVWLSQPTNASSFILLATGAGGGSSGPTLSQIVNGVLDELLSGHLISGSAGANLNLLPSILSLVAVTSPIRATFLADAGDIPFVENTRYTLSVTFKDDTGTLVNPASVTFYALDASGNATTLAAPTNPSTGVFSTYWKPDSGGKWTITAKGTTPDIHLPDQTIFVQASFHP